MRVNIFQRMMESASHIPFCSVDGDGGGSDVGGGGDGSASSPDSTSSGGGGDGSASGAAPAPAATDDDPWAALGGTEESFEPEVVPVVPTPAPVAAAPQPAKPAAPTSPPPPPPAPAAAPAQPQNPAQPQPQAAPQAAPAMPSVAEPGALAAFMVDPTNLPNVINHLAQQHYQLSDDDVKAIETDVVTALPQLMGRIHANTVASVMRFMEQSVPAMLQSHTKVQTANNTAKDTFFAGVKGLDPKNEAHQEAAAKAVKLYRGMNPDATMDDIVANVGPILYATLKITPPTAAAPGAPPNPSQPRMRPVAAAFHPAIPSNGAPPQPQAPGAFDGLGASYDE